MAKKTRKQKQRAAQRRSPTAPRPRPEAPASTAATRGVPEASQVDASEPLVAAAVAEAEPSAGTRRRVERLTPAAAASARAVRPSRAPATAAAMFQPLDSDDAAIPFDRVPYVPADLRRVAVMAACMVVLIVIAAIVVSNVVH